MKIRFFRRLVPMLLVGILLSSALWAGGNRYYNNDRISYSLGLNFGYPPPYRNYGYYPGYGPYRPPYSGSIGFGYSSGYYDAFSLFFSLPIYFGQRYEPVPSQQTVLVPSVKRTTQSTPAGCLQQREYQTRIVIGGKEVPAYGTACLQADGSWQVVSGPIVDQ
jgi:hypothetical protein